MNIKKLLAIILSLVVVLSVASVGTNAVSAATSSSSSSVTVGVKTDHTPLSYSNFYYYSSLSTSEKKVYDKIYDSLLNIELSADFLSYKISADDFYDIYLKVISDHGELFYVDKYLSYSTVNSYTARVIFSYLDGNYGNGPVDKTAIRSKIKKFNQKTKEILNSIPVGASQLVKEKMIHDILADTVTYDHDIIAASSLERSVAYDWCSYGAIVEGSAVCEGYSEAFSYLCQCVGINATVIVGDANGGHMWNAARISGDWYLVDVTWDDTDSETHGTSYTYFNITSAQMGKNHTPYDDYLPFPTCTATKKSYKALAIDFENGKLPSNYKSIIDRIITYNEDTLPIYIGENGTFNSTIKQKYFTGQDSAVMKYIASIGYEIKFKNSYAKQGGYIWLQIESIKLVCTHSWKSATCTTPKTCKTCKTTQGKAKGHSYTNDCDKTCNTCGTTRSTSHTYKLTTTKKATLTANGKREYKCTCCGYITTKNAKTVYKPTSFKLSYTSYTYNGKVKTPTVTVKDSKGNTLKKGTDYDVTYASGRKNVGTYNVTIKLKGKYSGTKTLSFKINPAKTTISKVTGSTKKLTVTYAKKTTQVTGYEVQYSTSKSFTTKTTKTKTVTKNTTTSASITSIKAKTTYYVRVRTYKTVSGKKYYSGWSTVKSAKTK